MSIKPLNWFSQLPIFKLLTDSYLWLTVLLSLPVIGPLLQPGYHWGAHDARSAVYFLFQFDKAIQDGIWYPRWAPDFAFGYGYPFFNIYGPLSSYAGELFYLLGFGYTGAVKIVFALSAVLSGVAMYFFCRHFFGQQAELVGQQAELVGQQAEFVGQQAGLIAALSYVYIPYHLFDLYVRAALAESVGLIFVPLTIWAFYQSVTTPTLKNVLWGSVAYAGLMFSSNLLALLLTPFLGLYVFIMLLFNKPYQGSLFEKGLLLIRRAIPPGATLWLGLGLSAIFWLPAFVERQHVRLDQWLDGRYAFGSDFVDVFQLFSPRWGFGASIPGPNDEAGFQVGVVAIILFIFSFWVVPCLKERSVRLTLYFLQGLTILIVFLTTSLSMWIWKIIPLANFAQFPWRMLAIVAPTISIVAGTIVVKDTLFKTDKTDKADNEEEQNNNSQPYSFSAVFIVALLIVLASFPYLKADVRDPKPTEGPVSLAGLFRFQQSSDELTGSTAWVKEIPTWSPLADLVISGGQITSRVIENQLMAEDGKTPLLGVDSFEIDSVHEFVWVYAADNQQTVSFYIPYYPGWTATIYEDIAPDRPDLYPKGRIGPVVATPTIQTTNQEGWMVVPVPAGNYFLELRFKDTTIRKIGKWLSVLSLILMLSLFLYTKYVIFYKSSI